MTTTDEKTSACIKCGQIVNQFDTQGGLWVGDLPSGGRYDCPTGGLHEPAPDSRPTVEHGPDGTLVHGTSRDDVDITAALKSAGFRWSRNLGAWFLPRTWTQPTRDLRVRQLEAALGDRIAVERLTGPGMSAAERDAARRERAAERAERMDDRSERKAGEAHQREQIARSIGDMIPMGQPILVGHHSQRRHERDLERIRSNSSKAWEAEQESRSAAQAADRARRVANGEESKVTIGNRIERKSAELRDIQRKLDGTSSAMHGKASGDYRDRLEGMKAALEDDIAFDRSKLEAAGGVTYSRETVKRGDFVKVRGQWYPVRRSNVKTVSTPSPMVPTYTHTSPWHEVQAHISAEAVTRDDVARMVQGASAAFPGLAAVLAEAAPAAVAS